MGDGSPVTPGSESTRRREGGGGGGGRNPIIPNTNVLVMTHENYILRRPSCGSSPYTHPGQPAVDPILRLPPASEEAEVYGRAHGVLKA